MTEDLGWSERLRLDLDYGFLTSRTAGAPLTHNPRIVLNGNGSSVLREIRSELRRCRSFFFSVAFVSPSAIAHLKQDLIEFGGVGHIVTSDYLGFNSPEAFAELESLGALGFDIRLHRSESFHPKGYVFEHADSITTMIGSANLTQNALLKNHEWNLKVSAARDSDLAAQLDDLLARQIEESEPISRDWIEAYRAGYVRPSRLAVRAPRDPSSIAMPDGRGPALFGESNLPATEEDTGSAPAAPNVTPNSMQVAALEAIQAVRDAGEKRAIVISATGTGKTMLSALDVRAVAPRRLLFVVHREQILDRTIVEYKKVLGGHPSDYGKLTGSSKHSNAKYLFATVQTLSKTEVLEEYAADVFDYVIIDEAHRAGSSSYRRILAHFDPVFMLGMTATPERTDGFNVFELFHHNVPYEIRLNHALEANMLAPFHYYGISDATFDDGSTVSAESDLRSLISPERVSHLLRALSLYGQAGVEPRGLIFCSSTAEARELSVALNRNEVRGRRLRTAALTGSDAIGVREAAVESLESGALDYLLTVDIFNEGVDIPAVNQVVMLRQTQSAIVFVQQLGRGLRKHASKDYLVVIDFIGNYATNFLIPIALFGDDSLNKESLRKNLLSAEESGVLPGLSSVQFDEISQARVLASIRATKLDDMSRIKAAMLAMRNRVGGVPKLWDFYRFESVDPVLLATKKRHYLELAESTLRVDAPLPADASAALQLFSHEVMTAKRLHEYVLARALLDDVRLSREQVRRLFESSGIPSSDGYVDGAIETLTLAGYAEVDINRYSGPVAAVEGDSVFLLPHVVEQYRANVHFSEALDDLIITGSVMVRNEYQIDVPFTQGRQYSRKEVLRQLCWPRKWGSTLYGYKVDRDAGPIPACPIFVTLHKSDDISASTAYEDRLIDASTLLWYTRSRRTFASSEVRAIIGNEVRLFVFVKKDDAEGSDFYFLGEAGAHDAVETVMAGGDGASLPVVKMLLRFESPIETALFDYLHPTVHV